MEESYFDTLKKAIQTDNVVKKTRAAGNWFRTLANRAKAALSNEKSPQKLLSREDTVGKYIPGKMYFFSYNPKWKNILPYYDTFPLVIPIERYKDGFLGINFHYLYPKDRAILMDQIKAYANNKKYDKTTRLIMTYNMLKGFSKHKRARPTIHRYLNNKINSMFVPIEADEWGVALFLPVERFKKANKKAVWEESKKIYNKR